MKRTRPTPELLLLVAVLAIVVVVNVVWLIHFRAGYPLDIDESGYMAIGFHYANALTSDGLSGFWYAFTQQDLQAPLVPLLAVPAALIQKSILATLCLQQGFLIALVLLTYGIATRLVTRRMAVIAAVTVAVLPGVTNYSRMFLFAVPSAALSAAALFALLRSESLSSRRWSIAFGAFLGLGLLTRTVMLALLPGLIIAGGLLVATRPSGRRAALVNLALAITVGVALAAVWYAYSLHTVLNYLTAYGYGTQSNQGMLGSVSELKRIVEGSLNLPTLLVLLLAWVGGLVVTVRRMMRASGEGGVAWRHLAGSAPVMLFVVVAEGYVVLGTTHNAGSGFELPLLAPIVVLACWGLERFAAPKLRMPASCLVVALGLFNVLATSSIAGVVSGGQTAALPLFGAVPVNNGLSPNVPYFKAAGYGFQRPPARWPPSLKQWNQVDLRVARALVAVAATYHRVPSVAFGSLERLLNTNSVALAAELHLDMTIDIKQIRPAAGLNARAAYQKQLLTPGDPPNLLVLTPGETGAFVRIDQGELEAAAERIGFSPAARIRLPDARNAEILWRHAGARAASR